MINLLPCKDDADTAQTNLQEVQQLVNQNNVFALFSLTQDDPARLDRLPQQQPGAVLRLGLPARVLRRPVGLRLERLPRAATRPRRRRCRTPPSPATWPTPSSRPAASPTSEVRLAVQSENSAAGKVGSAQYTTLFKARGAQVVYNKTNFPATPGRRRDALRPGDDGVQAEHRDDLDALPATSGRSPPVSGRPATRASSSTSPTTSRVCWRRRPSWPRRCG